MRAFIALDLDESFMVDVAATGTALRGHRRLSKARWVRDDVMHVTLRFLGETDLVAPLSDLVMRLGAHLPIAVKATGLVAFPDMRSARVLAIGLEGAFDAIARECEEAVVALGFPPDKRAFSPHLTLARFRDPTDVREVTAPLSTTGHVVAVTLVESVLGKAGPTYTAISCSRPVGTPSGPA